MALFCAAAGGAMPPVAPGEPVTIALDEPVVVARAPAGEKRWGYWQFPRIERLADGRLHASWSISADSAKSYGNNSSGHAVSIDQGKTWSAIEQAEADTLPGGTLLANGDRLKLAWETPVPADSVVLPQPIADVDFRRGEVRPERSGHRFYNPAELPALVRQGYPQFRMAKGTSQWVKEYPSVAIPGVVTWEREGVLVRPFFMGNLLLAPDRSLWTSAYWPRLVDGKVTVYIPTFVRSIDHGRTWNFASDIPFQPDQAAQPGWKKADGFAEPEVTVMPDGSMLALLRGGLLYVARSTDKGQTWGRPRVFDKAGVLPQLLVLESGITLAAYGRPGVFVRATGDKSGQVWNEPVSVPLHKAEWGLSCGYTGLLALDERTALLIYSDFGFPDEDGRPRKTILIRRATLKTVK
jgi:hypothetical protein